MDDRIRLYEYKNDYLVYKEYYEEIGLYSFLELIFNSCDMPFEEAKCEEYIRWRDNKKNPENQYIEGQPYKYNALVVMHRKGTRRDGEPFEFTKTELVLREGSDVFEMVKGNPFAIMSPITYVGNRASYKNARYIYALAFDLDGVGEKEISDLFYQIGHTDERVKRPRPNIIVNSGNGFHLYYLLDKPIPMYRNYIDLLNKLKHGLTYRIKRLCVRFGLFSYYCNQVVGCSPPPQTLFFCARWAMRDAFQAYEGDYCTFSRNSIEHLTRIRIPKNKRDGRVQGNHIKIMNAIKQVTHLNDSWRNKEVRPVDTTENSLHYAIVQE